jgi:hypothetical protein
VAEGAPGVCRGCGGTWLELFWRGFAYTMVILVRMAGYCRWGSVGIGYAVGRELECRVVVLVAI